MSITEFDPEKSQPEKLLDFSFSCNFDPLKGALNYIMEQLREHNKSIKILKEKEVFPLPTSDLKEETITTYLKELKERIEKLERKLSEKENKLNENTEAIIPNSDLPQTSSLKNIHDISLKEEEKIQTSPGVLSQPNSLPPEIEHRLSELEIELKKMKLRTISFQPSVPEESSEPPVDEWKEKVDLMKLELKSFFVDKKEFQNTNLKIEQFEKAQSSIEARLTDEINNAITKLKKEYSDFSSFFEQNKEGNATDSNRGKEEIPGDSTPTISKITENDQVASEIAPKPVSEEKKIVQPVEKKIPIYSSRDQQTIKTIQKKLVEIDAKIIDLKSSIDANSFRNEALKEEIDKIQPIIEKKCSVLDLKKAQGSIDELRENNQEMLDKISKLHEHIKTIENNEELKVLKIKHNSLEGKLSIAVKNLKELQAKVSESMGMQIIPQNTAAVDDRHEDQIRELTEEITQRMTEMKLSVQQIKHDSKQFTEVVNRQVENKAEAEALIELENKLYKELDHVLMSITRKIAGEESKREIKKLQIHIKRIYNILSGSGYAIQSSVDDASFAKRSPCGMYCLSCEREIQNVSSSFAEPSTWNKLPSHDTSLNKGPAYAKQKKYKFETSNRSVNNLRNLPIIEGAGSHSRIVSMIAQEEKSLPEIQPDKKH